VPYHHKCIAGAVQAQGKIFASAFIFWLQLVLMDNNVGASKHKIPAAIKKTRFLVLCKKISILHSKNFNDAIPFISL
jgi:hypothetical protein